VVAGIGVLLSDHDDPALKQFRHKLREGGKAHRAQVEDRLRNVCGYRSGQDRQQGQACPQKTSHEINPTDE
jgi:hypothetical protein